MNANVNYGDYKILERLARGGCVEYFEMANQTMREQGLIEPDVRTVAPVCLRITEAGREYLKKHKCPPFPGLKVSSMTNKQAVERFLELTEPLEAGGILSSLEFRLLDFRRQMLGKDRFGKDQT